MTTTLQIALILLLASITVRGQRVSQNWLEQQTRLKTLFEGALVNSSESLYQLQQIYFDPSSKHSRVSVCLEIQVRVHSISDPSSDDYCYTYYGDKNAFQCHSESLPTDDCTGNDEQWVLQST